MYNNETGKHLFKFTTSVLQFVQFDSQAKFIYFKFASLIFVHITLSSAKLIKLTFQIMKF